MEKTELLLLRCPFCSMADIQIERTITENSVRCANCGANIVRDADDPQLPEYVWNSRTPTPLTDEYQEGDIEKFFGCDPDFTGDRTTAEHLAIVRGENTLADEMLSKATAIHFLQPFDSIWRVIQNNTWRARCTTNTSILHETKDGFATPQEAYAWIMEGRENGK